MKSLGMTGGAMPRAKPSDLDRALVLIEAATNPKATKKAITEMVGAEKAANAAARSSPVSGNTSVVMLSAPRLTPARCHREAICRGFAVQGRPPGPWFGRTVPSPCR